jgi:hypothetical protein
MVSNRNRFLLGSQPHVKAQLGGVSVSSLSNQDCASPGPFSAVTIGNCWWRSTR